MSNPVEIGAKALKAAIETAERQAHSIGKETSYGELFGAVIAALEKEGYRLLPPEPVEAVREAIVFGDYKDVIDAAPHYGEPTG